jgi:hypothetical protein
MDHHIEQVKEKEKDVKKVNSYDMDTDEEIEEIKRAQAKEKASPKPVGTAKEQEAEPVKENGGATDEELAYDADTDIDEDVMEELRPKTSDLSFQPLPSYFEGEQFYLHGDYEEGEEDLVKRYIVACGGRVEPYMRETVGTVISASNWWSDDFADALEVNPGVRFLRPSWVFASSDQGRAVEEGTHRIRK